VEQATVGGGDERAEYAKASPERQNKDFINPKEVVSQSK